MWKNKNASASLGLQFSAVAPTCKTVASGNSSRLMPSQDVANNSQQESFLLLLLQMCLFIQDVLSSFSALSRLLRYKIISRTGKVEAAELSVVPRPSGLTSETLSTSYNKLFGFQTNKIIERNLGR